MGRQVVGQGKGMMASLLRNAQKMDMNSMGQGVMNTMNGIMPQPARDNKMLMLIIIAAVVLAGGAAFFYFKKKKKDEKKS